ncbi:MAG: polyisoprenoid-binding protein [Nitrospira sp.]|nr:polyisoprenoid-binding protein [Nitrospira sp.]
MMAYSGRHIRILALVCSVVLVATVVHAETARYELDPEHTTIGLSAGHMMVSQVQGQFMVFDGFVELDADTKQVKTIETTIKTWSINTNHQKRDAHLRSPDFLDVDRYPTMTYKLKSYHKTGEQASAIGDLTLHGVTRPVTLVGNLIGVVKDPMGTLRSGFVAEGKINRRDFNINFNALLDNGGMIVSDEVIIKINAECVKTKANSQ